MTTGDEALARMEALVRRMAARQEAENLRGGDYLDATDIVKALPEPIGVDLLLARQAFADEMLGSLPGSSREAIDSGRYDTSREMNLALAAVRYAREQYAVCGQEQPTLFGQCTLAEYDAAVKSDRPVVYPVKVDSTNGNPAPSFDEKGEFTYDYITYRDLVTGNGRHGKKQPRFPLSIRHSNGEIHHYPVDPYTGFHVTPEQRELAAPAL